MEKLDKTKLDKIVNTIKSHLSAAASDNLTQIQLATAAIAAYERVSGENTEETEEDSDTYSTFVSPIVLDTVDGVKAYILNPYDKSQGPMVTFPSMSTEDVVPAQNSTEFMDVLFRDVIGGLSKLDPICYNSLMFAAGVPRVYTKETPDVEQFTEYMVEEDIDDFLALNEEEGKSTRVIHKEEAEIPVLNPETNEPIVDQETDKQIMRPGFRVTFGRDITLRHPDFYVIPNERLFVSAGAMAIDDNCAAVIEYKYTTISKLMNDYPDAPKINDWKGKELDFWKNVTSTYNNIYTNQVWLQRWFKETSQEHQDTAVEIGIGDKKVCVADGEIYVDIEDNGNSSLCNIVVAGDYVLQYTRDLTERTFNPVVVYKTGNKWLGNTIPWMLRHEMTEDTANTRAFTDQSINAAGSEKIVDDEQVEYGDVVDSKGRGIIRRKRNAPNRPWNAIEYDKSPSADASNLQASSKMSENASKLTGVHLFQGHTPDDSASIQLAEASIKRLENNSNLKLSKQSNNFNLDFMGLYKKLYNRAIADRTDPLVIKRGNEYTTIDPTTLATRETATSSLRLSINDESESQTAAANVLTVISNAAVNPALAGAISSSAAYAALKNVLKTNNVLNFHEYLNSPEEVEQMIQEPAVKQFIEQQVQEISAQPEIQKTQSETVLNTAKAENITGSRDLAKEKLEHTKDKDAVVLAIKSEDSQVNKESKAVEAAIEIKQERPAKI